jgi:hypothetical protein
VRAPNISLQVFGDMAVVGYHYNRKIRSKMDAKGATVMYLGLAKDHNSDTHWFFNLQTNRVVLSCNVRWLEKAFQTKQTISQFR